MVVANSNDPSGQPKYSNMAITMCLTLGVVYKLPLRQTQGLMRGIVKLMGLDISVPDFSTLSRRGQGMNLPTKPRARRTEPVHLVVDSTGLKTEVRIGVRVLNKMTELGRPEFEVIR